MIGFVQTRIRLKALKETYSPTPKLSSLDTCTKSYGPLKLGIKNRFSETLKKLVGQILVFVYVFFKLGYHFGPLFFGRLLG